MFDIMKALYKSKKGRQQDPEGKVLEGESSINLMPRIVYVKVKIHPGVTGAINTAYCKTNHVYDQTEQRCLKLRPNVPCHFVA
jgi:hypothetical protein